jgi:CrcB protein
VSAATLLAAGALGGVGATARFALDGRVSARLGRGFPWGTFAVNVSAALVLGVLTGAALSANAERILGTGLVGGYSTFSTWVLESHRLAEDGRRLPALLNFGVSLLAGAGAFWVGRSL